MEGNKQHLQPLLDTTTTKHSAVHGSSSTFRPATDNHVNNIKLILSNSGVLFRVIFIFFIGVISLWANYEASKGFEITITNEAKDTPLGKRFALFYVSNDKISRLVINTSKFVEDILYPNETYPKKQVNRIIVQLASQNLTGPVIVESLNDHEFVLTISPSVMEEIDFSHSIYSAVQQGMARIWLWDGQGNAPRSLINGMVKYITDLPLLNKMSSPSDIVLPLLKAFCQKESETSKGVVIDQMFSGAEKNPRFNSKLLKEFLTSKKQDAIAVAQLLYYCEKHNEGFIRGLNQAMKDSWQDQMLDDALRLSAQHLCASFKSSS